MDTCPYSGAGTMNSVDRPSWRISVHSTMTFLTTVAQGKTTGLLGTKGLLQDIRRFHRLCTLMIELAKKSEATQIAPMSPHTAERRKAKRYRIRANAIFRWSGPNDTCFQGAGSTRDMSVDAVFILTPTCPPKNAVVHVEVILPLSGGAFNARLKADMTVLRVDHNVAGTMLSGFSAVGPGFLLRTYSERASQAVAKLIKEAETLEVQKD